MPRLTAAYHKVREGTKDWGDYEKLPEAIPEFPLIRRMLLGAVSVVQTPRLRAFETNERRVGNFEATMDTYFVGRNAAVLQYTRFAYTDQATRRRISNAATPKPGRLDEVLGLELSNFSRQLKLKPGIDDDHRVIVAMSNDLWFRAMEKTGESPKRKNSLETRTQLEAMVLRTKPEANQWLHLNPRVAALGADAFEQGPVMITKIHAYLLKEVNLAENAEEKTAEFVNRMCQITLETF